LELANKLDLPQLRERNAMISTWAILVACLTVVSWWTYII